MSQIFVVGYVEHHYSAIVCNYTHKVSKHPASTLLIMHAVLNLFAICIPTLQENYE